MNLTRYNFIPEHQLLQDLPYYKNEKVPHGWRQILLENASNNYNGWRISYHGPKNHDTIANTINRGYKTSKATRSQYGKGVYSSPFISDAEAFAETFKWKGRYIKAIFKNRVHMSYTEVHYNGRYYMTTNDRMIVPIAVLIKEC